MAYALGYEVMRLSRQRQPKKLLSAEVVPVAGAASSKFTTKLRLSYSGTCMKDVAGSLRGLNGA